jgi:hypothetical protein
MANSGKASMTFNSFRILTSLIVTFTVTVGLLGLNGCGATYSGYKELATSLLDALDHLDSSIRSGGGHASITKEVESVKTLHDDTEAKLTTAQKRLESWHHLSLAVIEYGASLTDWQIHEELNTQMGKHGELLSNDTSLKSTWSSDRIEVDWARKLIDQQK